MAETKYTYLISSDFPNHVVNTDRLIQEIGVSTILIALAHIRTEDDDCDIWFKDELSVGDKIVLDGVVAAHSGEPVESPPNKVELYGFKDMMGLHYWKQGYRWVMAHGETTNQQVKFTENIYLEGGGIYIFGDAADGDYIEFQIVDVDGLVSPAGTVLNEFISDDFCWKGKFFDVRMDDAKLIPTGLYLRCKYVSVGDVDVITYGWFHIRHAIT